MNACTGRSNGRRSNWCGGAARRSNETLMRSARSTTASDRTNTWGKRRPRPSTSPRSGRIPTPDYPEHFVVKKITTGGTFRFHTRLLYLANAMVDQHIGLEETDDGVWAIHFHSVLLATFDERDYIITD